MRDKMGKFIFLVSLIFTISAMNAQAKQKKVELTEGQKDTVPLAHLVTRQCKVVSPKICSGRGSSLVKLSIEEEIYDVAKSAAKSPFAHCIESKSGEFKSKIFVAKLEALEAPSHTVYGHDQVTIACRMPDGSKISHYLQINVFPKGKK